MAVSLKSGGLWWFYTMSAWLSWNYVPKNQCVDMR